MKTITLRDMVASEISGHTPATLSPPAGDVVVVETSLLPQKSTEKSYARNQLTIMVFPLVRRRERFSRDEDRIENVIRVAVRSRHIAKSVKDATRSTYENAFVNYVEDLEAFAISIAGAESVQTTSEERDIVSQDVLSELDIGVTTIDLTFVSMEARTR